MQTASVCQFASTHNASKDSFAGMACASMTLVRTSNADRDRCVSKVLALRTPVGTSSAPLETCACYQGPASMILVPQYIVGEEDAVGLAPMAVSFASHLQGGSPLRSQSMPY